MHHFLRDITAHLLKLFQLFVLSSFVLFCRLKDCVSICCSSPWFIPPLRYFEVDFSLAVLPLLSFLLFLFLSQYNFPKLYRLCLFTSSLSHFSPALL